MIIFGTRGITTTPERGQFQCPICHAEREFGRKRVRRFFTLYFIPVIPLDKIGEYVECRACKGTYKPDVLHLDPDQQKHAEAEFHKAVKLTMIQMLLSDGSIEESEVETAREVYERLTNAPLDQDAFLSEIERADHDPSALMHTLSRLGGQLNDHGKEMVVRSAYLVAIADGEFHEDEVRFISEVGQALGMTQAHLKGILAGG